VPVHDINISVLKPSSVRYLSNQVS